MISVSEAYNRITEGNIRPKCEPKITISGYNDLGESITFVWNPKDIKELTYKRGIDPIGRELPYMELTWTEIYSGKLDKELFPEKYNNTGKYMKVNLEFTQNLSFFGTWKSLTVNYWKDILSMSWKDVKNNIQKETIKFPTLFLTARPTYKNQTITWKAVDVLSFFEENQQKGFVADAPFLNPIKYLLINETGNFSKPADIVECIENSNANIEADDTDKIGYDIIFNGETKRTITEYLQLRNLYLDFEQDGTFSIKNLSGKIQNGVFTRKNLWQFPEVQKNPNVESYIFKSYSLVKNPDKAYTKTPVLYKQFRGKNIYKVEYDGYGEPYVIGGNGGGFALSLTYNLSANESDVSITPISWQSSDNTLSGDKKGEILSEDISMNPYDSNSPKMIDRLNYLKSYFDDSNTVSFSCLSNLSVTTGDTCNVETNLYNNGDIIKKNCLVVAMELKYNGTIKQSIVAHEFGGSE